MVIKDNYEISLWTDEIQQETGSGASISEERFHEYKVAILGSDSMSSERRAVQPCLIENINGTKTLTFQLFYFYIDTITGKSTKNSLVPLIHNESRIKLYWKNEWYDFVVKTIVESTDGKSVTYTCQDIFINELSKTGFNIEFATELENNTGTAQELAKEALKDSDWMVTNDSTIFRETVEEPLYKAHVVNTFTATNDVNNTSVSIPQNTDVYVYYSVVVNQNSYLQFIYLNGQTPVVGPSGLLEGIGCYYKNGTWSYNETSHNYEYKAVINNVTTLLLQVSSAFSPEVVYRGARPVRSPQTVYSKPLSRYVNIYQGNSSPYTTYYGYKTAEYRAPDTIVNLLTNPKDFVTTEGWYLKTTSENTLNFMLYPVFTTDIQPESYSPNSYLGIFGTEWVLNTALKSNSVFLDNGLSKGQEFVLQVEGYNNLDGHPDLTDHTSGVLLRPGIFGYNALTYEIDTSNRYTTIVSTTYDSSTNIYTVILRVTKPISLSEIYSSSIGLFFHFADNSNIEGTATPAVWIKNALFFEKRLDAEGNIIEPNQLDESSVITYVTKYYDPSINSAATSADDIIWAQVITSNTENDEWEEVSLLYDETYNKIRTISGKESTRYNWLQTIAETFKIWCRFRVEHNSDGSIAYEDGHPLKYVYFVESVGDDAKVGFVYGIDLKSITRTHESSALATKIIVSQNSNEFATNGFCTIARANDNFSKESYVLDFTYYEDTGLIPFNQVSKDLYLTPNVSLDNYAIYNVQTGEASVIPGGYDDIALYHRLREINTTYNTISDELAAREDDLNKQQGYLDLYQNLANATYTELQDILSYLKGLASLPAEATLDDVVEYSETHQDYPEFMASFRAYYQILHNYETYQTMATSLTASVAALIDLIGEDSAEPSGKTSYYLALYKLLQQKKAILKVFESKYARFIQEGSWISEDYIDDNLYYLDALGVAKNSSKPQVTYNISVLRLSALEEFKNKVFHLGDKSWIEDDEFFEKGYKEQVVVTQITSYLDSPEQDSFTIQNYRTEFEDLFQKITATVQSVQYASGSYDRAASILTTEGIIDAPTLAASIAANNEIVYSSYNNLITQDGTGITLRDASDPSLVTKIMASGIYISTDGGLNFKQAIKGTGISTQYLSAGSINTANITITDGNNNNTFRWDSKGITAYTWTQNADNEYIGINESQFTRFDRYGIYGVVNGSDFEIPVDEPLSEQLDYIKEHAAFGLTWGQFFLHNADGTGYFEISSDKDLVVHQTYTEVTGEGTTETYDVDRIKIGRLSGTGQDTVFGLDIRNKFGESVLTTLSDGELWLKKVLNISSSAENGQELYNIKIGYLDRSDTFINNNVETTLHRTIDVNEKFIVWEDGRVRATDGEFTGVINATAGILGDSSGTSYTQIDNSGISIYQKNALTDTYTKVFYADNNGTLHANGLIADDINVTSGVFENALISTGQIGGFLIEDGRLVSTDNDQNIILNGRDGSIVANTITLGAGATIADYINVGSSVVIYNPDLPEHDNQFLSVNNNTIAIFQDGTGNFGDINVNGIESTLSGNSWYISSDVAAFNNVSVRGTIATAIFEYDTLQTVGGQLIFRPAARVTDISNKESHSTYYSYTVEIDASNTNNIFKAHDYILLTTLDNTKTYGYISEITEGVPNSLIIYSVANINDFSPYYGATITNFGTTTDVLIGVNSTDQEGVFLKPKGISILVPIGENTSEFQLNYKSEPSVFLGDLAGLGLEGVNGFGLYGTNVYLTGSLTTEYLDEISKFAGVNTLSRVLFNKTINNLSADTSPIIFWAGAEGIAAADIQDAPFQVTSQGTLYATQAYIKGVIVTDSSIYAPDIYTAKIHGTGYDGEGANRTFGIPAALSLYDIGDNGINFYDNNENLIFKIGAYNFTAGQRDFISIDATENTVTTDVSYSKAGTFETGSTQINDSTVANNNSITLETPNINFSNQMNYTKVVGGYNLYVSN